METAKNELEIIKKYQDEGYTESYRVEEGMLLENTSKRKYASNEIHIVAQHRFEGMSNPDDMSILYVIKTKDDSKGTFLASYGVSSNTEVGVFFNEIPEEHITNDGNLFM